MPVQGNQYVVEGGDNLFSIAEKMYGDQRMFAEIMRLNRLGSGVIRPGMVLNLPRQKPSSQISIAKGLVEQLGAENKFVQTNNRLPTPAEMQQQISGQAVGGTPSQLSQAQMRSRGTNANYGQVASGVVETNQNGNPITYQNTPSSTYDIRRSRGYKQPEPISRQEYLSTIENPMRRDVTQETKDKLANAVKEIGGGALYGGIAGSAAGAPFAGVGAVPAGIGGAAIGALGGVLNLIRDPLTNAWKNYMGQEVNPQTGQPISQIVDPTKASQSPPRVDSRQIVVGTSYGGAIAPRPLALAAENPPQTMEDISVLNDSPI